MYKKYPVKPEQAQALEDLEKLIRRPIPLKKRLPRHVPGVKIDDDNVIGLNLHHCGLKILPKSIGNLKSLQILYLQGNDLVKIPESIGNLTQLSELNLSYNEIKTLPKSIGNLISIQTFKLKGNQLEFLPDSVGNLKSLKILDVSRNQLITLPLSFKRLISIEDIDLRSNPLMPKKRNTIFILYLLWLFIFLLINLFYLYKGLSLILIVITPLIIVTSFLFFMMWGVWYEANEKERQRNILEEILNKLIE